MADETEKTGKKCDPGNNQKTENAVAGILTAVIGAVVAALIPPLILAKIIDTVTAGNEAAFSVILLYFVLLALTGILEAAREGLLTVFGQKITHALRSSLMDKFVSLTADSVNKQEPGTLVSRFVGDVDTVENLFTSGIISMFADVCKIISILVVIWFQNRGLTLVLLVLLPFLFWFTRHVQKNMLAAQIENRKAVGRASGSCAGDASQYPHNPLSCKGSIHGRALRHLYRGELCSDGAHQFL